MKRLEQLFTPKVLHNLSTAFIALALLLNTILGMVNVPHPWSLYIGIVAVAGMIFFALDYPRSSEKIQENLAGSYDPILRPGIYPILGIIVIVFTVHSVVTSIPIWDSMTQSMQMSTWIDALFAGLLIAAMFYAHIIKPRMKRNK